MFSRGPSTSRLSSSSATATLSPVAVDVATTDIDAVEKELLEQSISAAEIQQIAVEVGPVVLAVAGSAIDGKVEDDQHAASSYKEAIFRQIEELQIAAGKRQQDLTKVVLDQTETSRRGKANNDSFVDDLSRVV